MGAFLRKQNFLTVGLCRTCFSKAREEERLPAKMDTWFDYMANDYPDTKFTRATLYLGNIPYETNEAAFLAWLKEKIKHCLPEKEVEYQLERKIVRSGHHVAGKCFKAFVFVEFRVAEHAFHVLQEMKKEGCTTWLNRRIPVHPAVLKDWSEKHYGSDRINEADLQSVIVPGQITEDQASSQG